MNKRAKAFAEAFVSLWKAERARGIDKPKVGRTAAMAVGYGAQSWCARNAVQTADVMHAKLIRRADVLAYIRELGLERDGKEWRETTADP